MSAKRGTKRSGPGKQRNGAATNLKRLKLDIMKSLGTDRERGRKRGVEEQGEGEEQGDGPARGEGRSRGRTGSKTRKELRKEGRKLKKIRKNAFLQGKAVSCCTCTVYVPYTVLDRT